MSAVTVQLWLFAAVAAHSILVLFSAESRRVSASSTRSADAVSGTEGYPAAPPRLFQRAASVVAVSWAIATALATWAAWAWLGPRVVDVLLISVGSGLIAACSLLPGVLWQLRRRPCDASAGSWDHLPALMSAAGIRLLGTVALFVLCRYQMAAASDEWIAAWVLGWYALLTAVEVTAVARELWKRPAMAGRNAGGGRSPVATAGRSQSTTVPGA